MPSVSASRTLNFDDILENQIPENQISKNQIFENREIDHHEYSDPPSSPILGTAEPTPKQICPNESK